MFCIFIILSLGLFPFPSPLSVKGGKHTHTHPHTHLFDDPGAQSTSGAHSPSRHDSPHTTNDSTDRLTQTVNNVRCVAQHIRLPDNLFKEAILHNKCFKNNQ